MNGLRNEGRSETHHRCSQDKAHVAPRSLGWRTPFWRVLCLRRKEGAGRSDRNLCFNISLCVCVSECMRVSNDCLQGLSAGPLSLFSAHPRSQCRPPPWQAGPAPGHPGWRGSVFGTMRTLWCAGGGVGGPRSSHHLCNAKRKMTMGPQSCGWGWRGAPLPGITTTLLGSICFRGHSPFFSVTSSMAISPR